MKNLVLIFALLGLALPWLEGSNSGVEDIGNRKQLFLDDHMIESLVDAQRVLNPAVKNRNNPVLKADRSWEGHYIGLGQVVYDEGEGIFKMWYRTSDGFTAKKGGERLRPYRWDFSEKEGRAVREKVDEIYGCSAYAGRNDWINLYATSRDGVHWEKPNLGLVEFQGSRNNNILPSENFVLTYYDPNDPDPKKRYKKVVKREEAAGRRATPDSMPGTELRWICSIHLMELSGFPTKATPARWAKDSPGGTGAGDSSSATGTLSERHT